MAMTIYTKDNTDIVVAKQATWGTAIADNATITTVGGATGTYGSVLDVAPTNFNPDARHRYPNRSNSGNRWLAQTAYNFDYKGCMPSFTLTGDAKIAELPWLLYSVLQNVTEGGTTPFTKTFTLPSGQPDFTASAGWFGTFWKKQPISSKHLKIKDAICKKLTLLCEPENGQGRMQFTAEMVGRGLPTADTPSSFWTANQTGTITNTRAGQSYYYFHDLRTCTVNGSAVNPLSIKFEIENNAMPTGVDTGRLSEFKTFTLGANPYKITMTVRLVYDSTTVAFMDDIGTQTVLPWIITWGATTDTTYGYFTSTIYGQVEEAPDVDEDAKSIDFKVFSVYDGTNNPFTAICDDIVDRGW